MFIFMNMNTKVFTGVLYWNVFNNYIYRIMYKLKLQAAFIGVQAVQAFKHKSIESHSILFNMRLSTNIIDVKHHLKSIQAI